MDIERLTGDKTVEDFEKRLLSLDSEFYFKCRKCGKCCIHQDTILFNPRDIFRIAKKLGKTMEDVINEYTESYIGSDSYIPLIHLLPRGKKEECPFLQNNHCSIHDCKPTVCALYPLGRAFVNPEYSGNKKDEVRYFLNACPNGSQKQRHTVREWLNRFGIPEQDEFFFLWCDISTDLGLLFRSLVENNVSNDELRQLWDVAYFLLYINYSTETDFAPQFREAVEKLMQFSKTTKLAYGVNHSGFEHFVNTKGVK